MIPLCGKSKLGWFDHRKNGDQNVKQIGRVNRLRKGKDRESHGQMELIKVLRLEEVNSLMNEGNI